MRNNPISESCRRFPLEYNDKSIFKACITKVKEPVYEGNTVDRRSTENEAQSNINISVDCMP